MAGALRAHAGKVHTVGYDYPGYGPVLAANQPRPVPSERGAYDALAAVLQWLQKEHHTPRSRIILCAADQTRRAVVRLPR